MLFELFAAVSFGILEGDGRRHTLAHLEAVKYYFKLLGIVLMRKIVAIDWEILAPEWNCPARRQSNRVQLAA